MTYIIAEAGVNHNGDVKQALRLVDLAKACGADAVKFQTFKAVNVVTSYAPKALYQREVAGRKENQLAMLKRLELDESAHHRILARCRQKKIDFLSTAFDMQSIDFLHRLGMKTFKIASGEITNIPYLRRVASVAQEVILSTGMSSLEEVIFAVDILVKAGQDKKSLTVLHCNTEYPTPPQDVNLRAMVTIRERLQVRVGYSDHTSGIWAALAATALGAMIIEKHLTVDRSQAGPDHKASLEAVAFKDMCEGIRQVEKMLGDGIKRPSPSEKKNMNIARRSIVAQRSICKGEAFTVDNVTVKRPGGGISPRLWDRVIGQRAKRDFQAEEAIVL
ncbi:MAG: N-acetylneuraminate synthase [Candidatus Omnitrophica bacterium]|nr:N-acetylneuraminate synthase [Candidatus Omnitrophota bacterium]MDE2223436.1 N-acetylneuraminate synthase [Candidatus Omnitrophota bacterium]